ncbi:helix-turn-helix domain-containing protein [Lutibacter sp.]|uniref:helix-turn-helix domain-containing protein n=1 Tax=Lutibacter sp. TaxID=1925666 RepID=UPI002736D929|nr:helix-turn-helix domain-containing protein [Lutibacter sp.]MDP3314090.1 helix-turn-helix domain-containing protein [Lutibacter sp.]
MSSNMQIPKTCQYCGKAFIAKTTVTKCCSSVCAGKAYKANKRREKVQSTIEQDLKSDKVQQPTNSINPNSLALKDYLSVNEASKLIGVSRWTIQRMIKKGQLNAVPFGNKHIVKRSQIESLFI